MSDLAIGIDLGGTNLRVAVFGGLAAASAHPERTGTAIQPLAEHQEPVGDDRSAVSIVGRIAAIVERLGHEAGGSASTPLGIGVAAMLRGDEGWVAQSPHLGWRDVPFGAMVRAKLPGRRVVVENDVNAITWGEYRLGAGRGARDVLAVFVGTGIGGGVVAEGRLVRGTSGCAGEIGHTKVVWDEEAVPCACGRAGCVEAYVGGEYLLRRVRSDPAAARSDAAVRAGAADRINPSHIDAAARAGDAWSLALWREIAPYLGVVLANATTLLDPGVLVLGGGVLSRTPFLRDLTLEAFGRTANRPTRENLAILDAALGDDAGVVGNALLALSAEPG
jgi:glucokinase